MYICKDMQSMKSIEKLIAMEFCTTSPKVVAAGVATMPKGLPCTKVSSDNRHHQTMQYLDILV